MSTLPWYLRVSKIHQTDKGLGVVISIEKIGIIILVIKALLKMVEEKIVFTIADLKK